MIVRVERSNDWTERSPLAGGGSHPETPPVSDRSSSLEERGKRSFRTITSPGSRSGEIWFRILEISARGPDWFSNFQTRIAWALGPGSRWGRGVGVGGLGEGCRLPSLPRELGARCRARGLLSSAAGCLLGQLREWVATADRGGARGAPSGRADESGNPPPWSGRGVGGGSARDRRLAAE